jgi:hypothetical protein
VDTRDDERVDTRGDERVDERVDEQGIIRVSRYSSGTQIDTQVDTHTGLLIRVALSSGRWSKRSCAPASC